MQGQGPLQFGPYVVLEQIGSGGMGAVYRARDRRLERDVAIKVLHRHLEMAGARERFLREARAVSSLNHPNISTIFDIGEQDGDPYLVMELLHGESLKDYLQDGTEMSQEELISIAMQAAQALAAAHAKGIVHRDIKPANLFLVDGPNGQPQLKVLDFGLAKMESDRLLYGDSGGLTRTGSTVGTVEYMSPEQARGEDLDPRSDLFSLGAVLYELATGDVPFRGATSAVVFAELLGSEPVPPRKANARVSPGMDAIIRHLLEKKRENRIPSANALLEELRKLKDGPASAPRGNANLTPAPPQAAVTRPPREQRISGESETRNALRGSSPVADPAARAVRGRAPSGSRPSAMHPAAQGDRHSGSQPSVQRDAVREPLRRGISTERAIAAPPEDEGAHGSSGGMRRWIPVAGVLVVAGAAAAFFLRPHGGGSGGTSVVGSGLQVTQFDNSTGDAVLQDVPAVAMQILLRQLPSLHVTGYAPAVNSADMDAQEMARRSGADTYLTGSVSRDNDRYHIHAEILRTADNGKLAQEDVDSPSTVEIPNALSHLAVSLRTHLGESPEQAASNTVVLSAEATNSLNALGIYARGLALRNAGQQVAAIEQFHKALADDGNFVPARLALVEALREAGAEPERLAAAGPLSSASGKGSTCQRDWIAYEIADTGAAAAQAAQAWAGACVLQPEAQVALARTFTADGRAAEAEAAAGRAADLDPAGRTALTVATETMIAQAHYESAAKEQAKASAAAVGSPGLALLAAYLRGDHTTEAQSAAVAMTSASFVDQWSYLTYLGDRGQLADARTFGEAAAQRMRTQAAVASSGSFLHARLAAMEAMAGHCGGGTPPVDGAGDSTKFYAGLADAWCKRPLAGDGPHDAGMSATVRAAMLWSNGGAQDALNLLQGEKPSAYSTVSAMLRGEAHLATGQQVLAISDFKAVMTRRGEALMTGTIVYPAAEAGLATAYHTMGDDPNASRTQDDLKALWKDADPAEPLLHRASK